MRNRAGLAIKYASLPLSLNILPSLPCLPSCLDTRAQCHPRSMQRLKNPLLPPQKMTLSPLLCLRHLFLQSLDCPRYSQRKQPLRNPSSSSTRRSGLHSTERSRRSFPNERRKNFAASKGKAIMVKFCSGPSSSDNDVAATNCTEEYDRMYALVAMQRGRQKLGQ